MKEINDLQRRRASNIIWSFAGRYDFVPDFRAYDNEGMADMYFNCIIGAARRYFDYEKIEEVFRALSQYEDNEIYEGILWLCLENCLYLKMKREVPVLSSLRERYANEFIKSIKIRSDIFNTYDSVAFAHYAKVAGKQHNFGAYITSLIEMIEMPEDTDTEALLKQSEILFKTWFDINTSYRRKNRSIIKNFKIGKTIKPAYIRFGYGFADHDSNVYTSSIKQEENEISSRLSKLSADELREFMSFKFGKSLFSKEECRQIEKKLCRNEHANCHLLYTKGEKKEGKIVNGFEALHKEQEKKQIELNRSFFYSNISANRNIINKLADKIRNSMLLYMMPDEVLSSSGKLQSGLAWKGLYLGNINVFKRNINDNIGNLSVDILLDASVSQKGRQEIVSSQGYMIAESLDKCGIPCRVMSFCSMTGYTILKIFREYIEAGHNDSIFDYVANGCNRDGLAIAAASYLIELNKYENRVLVIITDAKPNDVIKIQKGGTALNYEDETGILNTAYEVRKARNENIRLICIFTGDDCDLYAAKTIYGRDFRRVRNLDELNEAFGILLNNYIKNIG